MEYHLIEEQNTEDQPGRLRSNREKAGELERVWEAGACQEDSGQQC